MDYTYASAERIDYAAQEIRDYSTKFLVREYVGTLCWSELEDGVYTFDQFSEKSRNEIMADVVAFTYENAGLLSNYIRQRQMPIDTGLGHAMHDFVLTRNRHGAGFWDRGLLNGLGDKLTQAAQAFGEMHIYVGDDGLVHVE